LTSQSLEAILFSFCCRSFWRSSIY